jgi:hypothetical protein
VGERNAQRPVSRVGQHRGPLARVVCVPGEALGVKGAARAAAAHGVPRLDACSGLR